MSRAATLLAQPLANDPGMTTLTAEARNAPLQLGAVPLTGLGSIGEDGHIRMSSPLASADQLAGLARWVRAEVDEHPGLARAKNTMFLNISPGGIVRAIHQEPALWEGVPDALVPGSLAESAMRLTRLKAGRSCWFWLAISKAAATGMQKVLNAELGGDGDSTDLYEAELSKLKAFDVPVGPITI